MSASLALYIAAALLRRRPSLVELVVLVLGDDASASATVGAKVGEDADPPPATKLLPLFTPRALVGNAAVAVDEIAFFWSSA